MTHLQKWFCAKIAATRPARTNTLPASTDPLEGYKNFTRPFEGVKTKVYLDTKKVPTIGVGMNLNNPGANARLRQVGANPVAIRAGKAELTLPQVESLFDQDMREAVSRAQRIAPTFSTHPTPVQHSLADLSFNLGPKLNKFTNFLGNIGKTNYGGAASELKNSLWYGQVGNRSRHHVGLYNGLAQTNFPLKGDPSIPSPTPPPQPAKPAIKRKIVLPPESLVLKTRRQP